MTLRSIVQSIFGVPAAGPAAGPAAPAAPESPYIDPARPDSGRFAGVTDDAPSPAASPAGGPRPGLDSVYAAAPPPPPMPRQRASPVDTAESVAAVFLKCIMAVAGAIAVAAAAGMALAAQPSVRALPSRAGISACLTTTKVHGELSVHIVLDDELRRPPAAWRRSEVSTPPCTPQQLMIPRTLSQLTACAVGVGTSLVVVAGSVFGAAPLALCVSITRHHLQSCEEAVPCSLGS